MVYDEVRVTVPDGAELNAWYFPSNVVTTQLILISHNGEGNMADNLRLVDQFRTNGYNVMIYDYRGFGESSAFAIDNDMYIYPHFQDDLKAMIDYCRQEHAGTFDLYGWGIGAGLSLGIGWNRPEIKHIIADSPFLGMSDLEERFASWDKPMEVPFAGYEKKYEPINAVQLQPQAGLLGVMLIVGSNDPLYSPEDYQELKHALIKTIYVVDNPERLNNFSLDKAAYWGAIKKFLSES
jgi:pimeloyl-ACP methyl ester carboxylesterase